MTGLTDYIEIPHDRLAPDLLDAVMEEFIMREGTDYGEQPFTLEQKRAQLRRQLTSGRAMIVFDPVSETTTLLVK